MYAAGLVIAFSAMVLAAILAWKRGNSATEKKEVTALIVDDDPGSRLKLNTICRILGLKVFAALDGADGIAVFRSALDPPDVVFVNYEFNSKGPPINGVAVMVAVKAIEVARKRTLQKLLSALEWVPEPPATRFVIMHPGDDERVECIEAISMGELGADGFLGKPPSREEIEKILRDFGFLYGKRQNLRAA